jgi:uncharacterized protein (DUF1800 family)
MLSFLLAACSAALTAISQAQVPSSAAASPGACAPLVWNERAVRHLYARAGFGASEQEVVESLAAGAERTVAALMLPRRPWIDVEPVLVRWEEFDLGPDQVPLKQSKYSDPEQGRLAMVHWRALDRRQFHQHAERWFQAMIAHDDPLRDRMTLFWHGRFTTSFEVVKRKYEILQQHSWLRAEALGSFASLLHGLVRDPAMLQYLDNNTNVRGHPNENFARELMELYSLGEGHYTEHDVREAARALTGFSGDPEGHFGFRPEVHDGGAKTVLGHSGNLTGDDLVEILLKQPACAAHLSAHLLEHFEGRPASAERLAEYAQFMRDSDYRLQPWLERLFLDPCFYRDELLGSRVQGPLEFLVGFCRKTSINPPPGFLFAASSLLGQTFYAPPTVRGWDEGLGWITNDALMQRGNAVGVLLGVLFGAELPDDAADALGARHSSMVIDAAASNSPDDSLPPSTSKLGATTRSMLRLAGMNNWQPDVDFVGDFARRGAHSDAQIVDNACARWLAVPLGATTRGAVLEFLARERAAAGILEGELNVHGAAQEMCLRRMVRLLFSLPEAQLN